MPASLLDVTFRATLGDSLLLVVVVVVQETSNETCSLAQQASRAAMLVNPLLDRASDLRGDMGRNLFRDVGRDLLDHRRGHDHCGRDHSFLTLLQKVKVEARRVAALFVGGLADDALGHVHDTVGEEQVHALGGNFDGGLGDGPDSVDKVVAEVVGNLGNEGVGLLGVLTHALDVVHDGLGQVALEVDLGIVDFLGNPVLDVRTSVLLEIVEEQWGELFHGLGLYVCACVRVRRGENGVGVYVGEG